jgi:hypothetical protein
MLIHSGVPKLWNFKEVAEMNLKRPPEDQIELNASKLPTHHCAFPKCEFCIFMIV